VRKAFRDFARNEARDRSVVYERLAVSVAGSDVLIDLIASLPPGKRQPNLVLAAACWVCGPPNDPKAFLGVVAERWAEITAVVQDRTTQTNEPARCATLLPLLASLPQPLALVEVGASAGLCLLPDRYGYQYDGELLQASLATTLPIFPCETTGDVPLPSRLPDIVWRRGLDIDPVALDATDKIAWLEALVWPGEVDRLNRLREAISVARADPPIVVRGDLLTDLERVASEAPSGATLVVFHTAVLAYVRAQPERNKFVDQVSALGATWISNEEAAVFPQVTAQLDQEPPRNRFLLALDGKPVALTGPHGQSLEWL